MEKKITLEQFNKLSIEKKRFWARRQEMYSDQPDQDSWYIYGPFKHEYKNLVRE